MNRKNRDTLNQYDGEPWRAGQAGAATSDLNFQGLVAWRWSRGMLPRSHGGLVVVEINPPLRRACVFFLKKNKVKWESKFCMLTRQGVQMSDYTTNSTKFIFYSLLQYYQFFLTYFKCWHLSTRTTPYLRPWWDLWIEVFHNQPLVVSCLIKFPCGVYVLTYLVF